MQGMIIVINYFEWEIGGSFLFEYVFDADSAHAFSCIALRFPVKMEFENNFGQIQTPKYDCLLFGKFVKLKKI